MVPPRLSHPGIGAIFLKISHLRRRTRPGIGDSRAKILYDLITVAKSGSHERLSEPCMPRSKRPMFIALWYA